MTALEAWMTANGEKDHTLAPKIGVSRVHVCRIRRGDRTSPKTARLLEEVTGIPAATFVFGEAKA